MMAGDIFVSDSLQWPANGSVFSWVLGFLTEATTDPAVREELEEIDEHNLGMLDLDSFAPPARAELLTLLSERLVPHAEAELPPDVADRTGFLDELRTLADMARSA
ncbi:MAG: hypothetical protein GEV10_21645 [Streptosporangiales bacterium]|nr:hypothetical protein [Streptosporangiales bacterium]